MPPFFKLLGITITLYLAQVNCKKILNLQNSADFVIRLWLISLAV